MCEIWAVSDVPLGTDHREREDILHKDLLVILAPVVWMGSPPCPSKNAGSKGGPSNEAHSQRHCFLSATKGKATRTMYACPTTM
eukprot:9999641-Karenia_brevis.AAC.1